MQRSNAPSIYMYRMHDMIKTSVTHHSKLQTELQTCWASTSRRPRPPPKKRKKKCKRKTIRGDMVAYKRI